MSADQAMDSADAQDPPLLTIDGRSYNLLEAPEPVKILIDDMTRIAREVNELQSRLRQAQLSQQAYVLAIEKELNDNNVEPYRIDPEQNANS